MAAYSLYLQLLSIAAGRFLHSQPEPEPFCGDMGPTQHQTFKSGFVGVQEVRWEAVTPNQQENEVMGGWRKLNSKSFMICTLHQIQQN
jgi:hypothetical protein